MMDRGRTTDAFDKRRTFKAAFCEMYQCPPDRFTRAVFWRCLYPQAVPVAALFCFFVPVLFAADLRLIAAIGELRQIRDLNAEVARFSSDLRLNQQAIGRALCLRVSGRKLLKLAGFVLSETERCTG
jgi:hypothetical protein